MSDKGKELNKRVWRLFEKAGFETKPNSDNQSEETIMLSPTKPRTLDLSASIKDLDVKIIGWNKARRELKESLTVHIHDYETLKEITGANSVLFVSTEKEVSEEDKAYVEQKGMRIWGQKELQYYDAIADAIGHYAKYEIIHSFGIETAEQKFVDHVLALKFNQPYTKSNNHLFIFTTTPEKLLKTCVIYRKARGSGEAYQRMLRKDRLTNVRRFVTKANALLPPNIIVNLSEDVTWDPVKIPKKDLRGTSLNLTSAKDYELVVLKMPMAYASLELIDGQHRLYGFTKAEPATRENFNLVVLGIANLPFKRRRETFVAINDKFRRMDPNLVAYLKYTDDDAECQKDPELMAIKLVVELNKTTFKDKVRLLDVGEQKITLKGFSGYDLRGLVGRKGLLRKYYSNESKEYLTALRIYFGVLKSLFKEQWEHPEKYIIFTNSGISAFLKLLKSILKDCQKPLNENVVLHYLQPLRDKWQDSDLETDKIAETLRSTYVGSKGWKDLHRLFVKTIAEKHTGFQE